MKNLHLDIETGDPDDLWTLALMATHPKVRLKTVSVYPGGRDQIGLVKKVLSLVGREDVLVGADVKDDDKSRVGAYYTKWLGSIPKQDPDCDLAELSREIIVDSTLLTGGPLRNVRVLIQSSDKRLFGNWTAQGGFVGCNIIPDSDALEKFKGKLKVPTYNFGGHKASALDLLCGQYTNEFYEIHTVGKNVCHGFIFTKEDVELLPKGKHPGLDVMIQGMEKYCQKKPEGKAMHDILAALLCVNPEHGTWVRGKPVREKGLWGFEKDENSNIQALVSVDKKAVMNEL